MIKKKKKKLKKKKYVPEPPKRYREVKISTADNFMKLIDSRRDGVYDKMCVYQLLLTIRDLTYRGSNNYMQVSKHKAIQWFKQRNDKHPFGYGTICSYLNIHSGKLWLQIRRWLKVDPDYLASILKSVESGIF